MTVTTGRKLALVVLAGLMAAGCSRGPKSDPMTALSRGDYPAAERSALETLRAKPKDPHALMAAGMVYQATNRYDLARQYYEVIVTNQPQAMVMVPGEGPRQIVDVARANIAQIDRLSGRSVVRDASQSGRAAGTVPSDEPPMSPSRTVTGAQAFEGMVPGAQSAVVTPARIAPTQAETNVAGRFRTLRRLFDEGLITSEEYTRRRSANLGALLPYSTATPPSVGLDRPLPGDDVVVERLRALALALESRAITPRELAAERTAILDALIPSDARKVELPALAPRDMLEAAQAVGRLERLRAMGLVSVDEVAREREAIERALDGTLASARVTGSVTGLRHGQPPAAANGAAGYIKAGQGVLLAIVKSEDAARKAWAGIKQRYPEQLDKLEATFKRVDLGEKGVRWRVLAGPLSGAEAARSLCKTLKLHRQSCDPAPFEKAK